MDSDAVRPEGRQGTRGDSSAKAVIWVSFSVLILSTWVIVLSKDPASLGWFKFHPLLQTLSIGCFTILTPLPTSQPKTKAASLQKYQIARIVVVPLVLLGTLAVFLNKANHNVPHFTTWHGTLGIIAVMWSVMQIFMGGWIRWFGGAASRWSGGKKSWHYHRLSGQILFLLVLITVHLGGGWSSWPVGHADAFVRLLAYSIAPLLILVGLYIRVRPSKMKLF